MTPWRLAALLWLATVLAGAVYLAAHVRAGLPLKTDLMALLPREERDSPAQQARDGVTRALSRRVLVLVGGSSRTEARAAAARLSADLAATGLFDSARDSGAEEFRKLGQLYFPRRAGLLSGHDRAALDGGRADELAKRGLAQAYGVGGIGGGALLRNDPFSLLPSFLAGLPVPMPRVVWDDGFPTVAGGGKTWVLLVRSLAFEPFDLDGQERLAEAFSRSEAALRAAHPGVETRRAGAVFFAEAGARAAIGEASALGAIALGGTALLVLAVFRRLGPLLLNVLAALIGAGAGLAGCLMLFGEAHVLALLFGASLLGVAVDYGLHYSSTEFEAGERTPRERLVSIIPGLALSLVATLIGYLALALAPLHGLRQIAVFAVFGLTAAFATVVLWFPILDRGRGSRAALWVLAAARAPFDFWDSGRCRFVRLGLMCAGAAIALLGFARIETNDDIRRMQALAPDLVRDQEAIFAVTGAKVGSEFLLVAGADDEAALRREEAIRLILDGLMARGAIAGALFPADFVPSAERQRENRRLVERTLDPLLASQRAALGLGAGSLAETASDPAPLTLDFALRSGGLAFLRDLVLAPGAHVAMLQGLVRPDLVREAFRDVAGVRFVEPASEAGALFGMYRERAVALIALSAGLMFVPFAFRYGLAGAFWVMLPPVSAVVLAPAILSLAGEPFNFFHAMALVLVLAIGVDYSVFCAESETATRATTMVSILLAAAMTLLSFGLLASSRAHAISSFGWGMLIGITLAFLLAPLAGRARRRAGPPVVRGMESGSWRFFSRASPG